MKNKDLNKGYNQAVSGKRNNRLAMLLVTGFCALVTLSALVLYLISNLAIADKVKVIDTTGRYIHTELEHREQLVKSGVQSHVHNTMYYLNSGDRSSLNTNKSKALFLIDRLDAYNIFERWKKERAYNNILRNGHVYKVIEVKVTHMDLEQGEPFPFKSEATLLVQDGTRQEYWLINGKGFVSYTTPSWPNNQWGMFISDYTQDYQKVVLDE